MERTCVGEVHGGVSPVEGTPLWIRETVWAVLPCRGRSGGDNAWGTDRSLHSLEQLLINFFLSQICFTHDDNWWMVSPSYFNSWAFHFLSLSPVQQQRAVIEWFVGIWCPARVNPPQYLISVLNAYPVLSAHYFFFFNQVIIYFKYWTSVPIEVVIKFYFGRYLKFSDLSLLFSPWNICFACTCLVSCIFLVRF